MGRQGPAPKLERAEEGPPSKDSVPSPALLPRGREPTAAGGLGVMDTFMIEKQLEWRQERHTIIWAESVGGMGMGPGRAPWAKP